MDNLEALLKNYLQSNEKRLDRIETKIDHVSSTLVALARAEEKLIVLEKARDKQNYRLELVEERLMSLDKIATSLAESLGFVKRIFWIAVTGLGTAYAGFFITKLFIL